MGLLDLTDLVGNVEFGVFRDTVAAGGKVRAFRLPGGKLSRAQLDALLTEKDLHLFKGSP